MSDSNAPAKPQFYLNADSLLSKWGFGDGDGLSDWWWDNFDEEPPFDADEVLYALVETYLLPLIREAGYEATLTRIGTTHNPVRIEFLNGTEVDWYKGDNTFEPPIEVSVTRAQMETTPTATRQEAPMGAETEVDERIGKPDCDCGHTSMRHHGSRRDANGFLWSNPRHEFNGCKDCSWCDYYKPRYHFPLGRGE